MSDVFWALLGLGVAGVAGVAVMEFWRNRQTRKAPSTTTLAAAAGVSEPRFDEGVREPATTQAAPSPAKGVAAAPQDARLQARAVVSQEAVLDPATDGMATFGLDDALPGERLYALSQSRRRVGGKPVLFEGVLSDSRQDEWHALAPRGHWKKLRAGVLLANRNGPLNAIEWNEFVQAVQTAADALGVPVDISEGTEVLDQARELDRYCSELDAQLGLNVRVRQPVSANAVATVASMLGLVERGNNRFAALDEHGQLLFSATLGDSARYVSLLLDVPRAPHAARPYERMTEVAQEMALRLDGELVDDDGQLLDPQALQAVGLQLQERYAQLAASGMPAGSPRALRLFN